MSKKTTASASSTWNGNAMTQSDMMLKDTVLVLNEFDEIIGSASKKESHVFMSTPEQDQPRGILHRAFSVFLFDESTNALLLQQRASTKITFPNVWTNTCCSHPLHGMDPSEVDDDVLLIHQGIVHGVVNAAIRKLHHELGIDPATLDPSKFKFLTRLHYWAADTVTHGPDSPWGEHEIDYVLFYTIPNRDAIAMTPHPDEVDAIQWVTSTELQSMLKDPHLLFSPWFRLIVQKWMLNTANNSNTTNGAGWWTNLKETMTTNKYCDYTSISRFDPPEEHLGGAGKAGKLFNHAPSTLSTLLRTTTASHSKNSTRTELNDETKKQGAYGKIKTHKESMISQVLFHPDEVWSAITLLYLEPLTSNLETPFIRQQFSPPELSFCDAMLGKVSRSFAAVIRQLPSQLLVDVMIFYLVLRALDTIEDDTTAFATHDEKIAHLMEFHQDALNNPNWTITQTETNLDDDTTTMRRLVVGQGDEAMLLQEFQKCQLIYTQLSPDSRTIIADITKQMATGMAEFVSKDMGQGTIDVSQYNLYCHYVAGLVGEGLTRLFAASGLEDIQKLDMRLADQMGLFLQKVNIIRDYLEDYVDGRAWWPRSIWSKYSPTGDLGYFAQVSPNNDGNTNNTAAAVRKMNAIHCLNELITDALELAPDCLHYMSRLQCLEIFRFCAIPQVMAIATLDVLYANPKVFTGVVKIRKGLSCQLILQTNTTAQLHSIFYRFAKSIQKKLNPNDPSYDRTMKACQTIIDMTEESTRFMRENGNNFGSTSTVVSMVVGLVTMVFIFHIVKYQTDWLESVQQPVELIMRGVALVIFSLVFLRDYSTSSYNKEQDPTRMQLKTANEILVSSMQNKDIKK